MLYVFAQKTLNLKSIFLDVFKLEWLIDKEIRYGPREVDRT